MENEKTVNFFDVDLSKEMLRLSIKKCMITSIDYRSSLSLSLSLFRQYNENAKEKAKRTTLSKRYLLKKGRSPIFLKSRSSQTTASTLTNPSWNIVSTWFFARVSLAANVAAPASHARKEGRTDGRMERACIGRVARVNERVDGEAKSERGRG